MRGERPRHGRVARSVANASAAASASTAASGQTPSAARSTSQCVSHATRPATNQYAVTCSAPASRGNRGSRARRNQSIAPATIGHASQPSSRAGCANARNATAAKNAAIGHSVSDSQLSRGQAARGAAYIASSAVAEANPSSAANSASEATLRTISVKPPKNHQPPAHASKAIDEILASQSGSAG